MQRTIPGVIFFILLSGLIQTAGASAQWKPIGPRGGYIRGVVADRNQPGVWYCINSGSLYRSNDDAKSWQKLMDRVVDVAIHPQTSGVYAIVAGEKWDERKLLQFSKNGASSRVLNKDVLLVRVFFDPKNLQHLYGLGFQDQPFAESLDGGKTWNFHYRGPEVYFDVEDLVVSPADRRVLFLRGTASGDPCCDSPETYVSYDGGKNWKYSEFVAEQFVQDPLYPDRILAIGNGKLAELVGRKWKMIAENPPGLVAMVPGRDNHLVGVRYNGELVQSQDLGKTWTALEKLTGRFNQILVQQDESNSILVAGNLGIYKRIAKNVWKAMSQGFGPSSINHVVRIADPGVVLATPDYSGIYNVLYRKEDAKSYWETIVQTSKSRTSGGVLFAAHPDNKGQVFLAKEGGLYVSMDAGRRWQKAQGLANRLAISSVQFTPSDARIVYALQGSRLYRSKDRGFQFQKVAEFLDDWYRLIVDPQNAALVTVVSRDRILVSKDFGSSFQSTRPPNTEYIVSAVRQPALNALLVGCGSGRIYRLPDGSGKWEKVSSAFLNLYPQSILNGDLDGWRLYLRIGYMPGNVNLLESRDGGVSWKFVAGLGSDVYVVDMSDTRYSPVYLATNQGVLMQK